MKSMPKLNGLLLGPRRYDMHITGRFGWKTLTVSRTGKIVSVSVTELRKSIQEVVFWGGFVVSYSMPLQYLLT